LLPQLVKHFPESFERFINPFMGGGAIGFALREGQRALLNDMNLEIVDLYTVIRERPLDLMAPLEALSENDSEEFFYQLRKERPTSEVALAARTVILNKTVFNGLCRKNSKGEFNVPFGKRVEGRALYDRANIARVSNHLKLADLRNEDFGSVLVAAGAADFVYCDPPYEPLALTSSFNSKTGGGFPQSEQARLRDACADAAKRGATVAVSNSSAPIIKDL
jgi:DNA adenine methylase